MRFSSNINDYIIGDLLGRGGFGQVYQAQLYGNHYAIKILDKRAITQAAMTQRVRHEVEIHSHLDHPSILKLYHWFEDSKHVYLIMELCSRGSVYKLLRHRSGTFSRDIGPENKEQVDLGKLSESEARYVMIQLVNGLLYLHSVGCLHRDLKLSNLLLNEDFDVKIADFGLAVKLNDAQSSEQRTLCGTPNYISPEIVSRQPYGLTTDIWSLGCMFYTMLVGKAPFESQEDVKCTLDNISKAEYQVPKNLSTDARDLISGLLQRHPSARIPLANILSHNFFKHAQKRLRPCVIDSKITDSSSKSLEALNTNRLKPIKQNTKHGVVEISSSGHLIMDLSGDKYRIMISPDGFRVDLFKHPISPSWNYQYQSDSYYTLDSGLPQKLQKKYRYAYRFVSIVRSKTAKIVLYSAKARFILMENSPMADFDCSFYEGLRFRWYLKKGEIEISHSKSNSGDRSRLSVATWDDIELGANDFTRIFTFGRGRSFRESIPREFWHNWELILENYVKCLETELALEKSPGSNSYPLVLRADQNPPNTRSNDDRDTDVAFSVSKSDDNLSDFRSSIISSSPMRVSMSDASSISNSSMSSPFEESQRSSFTRSRSKGSIGMNINLHQRQIYSSPGISENRNPNADFGLGSPSPFQKTTTSTQTLHLFLPNIGWCIVRQNSHWTSLKNESLDMNILFNDGYRIECVLDKFIITGDTKLENIKSKLHFIKCTSPHSDEKVFNLRDEILPVIWDQKLQYLSSFIDLFRLI